PLRGSSDLKQGEAYHFTAQIRVASGKPKLRIELYSSWGALLDTLRLENFTDKWAKHSTTLRPRTTDQKAKLYILVDGAGTVDLDMVSLFLENTWKKRPGGLRADMVQMLADMKPGFLRF